MANADIYKEQVTVRLDYGLWQKWYTCVRNGTLGGCNGNP